MTLRFRLVTVLLLLTTVGLGVFGFVTYSLYSRSQYDRLDQQLRGAAGFTEDRLTNGERDLGFGSRPTGPDEGRRDPDAVPAVGYAELRDASGTELNSFRLSSSSSTPDLPADLTADRSGRFLDVDATQGSTRRRVFVRRSPLTDNTVIVSTPLASVDSALTRLVLIEVMAGAGLLTLLGMGSWFIMRRGLRPLEVMVSQARSINAGDLSQRVEPAGGSSEVGQLGLALNTMLTEIEDAFRERDATERRLRQFLSDVSHELRTPLTSIQGFAELFRMGADEDRAQLETIFRRIEQESERMRVLVEDLLLLARLDETRPMERRPVDLAVLAADACSDVRAIAPDRPVTLDAPQPVVVPGDQNHLRQAIANLATNAVRHTPAGSPIEVAALLDGGVAVITVRDHGPGLDAEALAHVFDRFWQADRARVGTGTGLGLAIVAGIAEEHGGTVEVRNVTSADGGGAEFTLRLPLNAADGEPATGD